MQLWFQLSIDGGYDGSQSSLTRAELEQYSRAYEEVRAPSHSQQPSYAQSEGYHSYVSSSDSTTTTPFLDRYNISKIWLGINITLCFTFSMCAAFCFPIFQYSQNEYILVNHEDVWLVSTYYLPFWVSFIPQIWPYHFNYCFHTNPVMRMFRALCITSCKVE